jgi:hypothetical protein
MQKQNKTTKILNEKNYIIFLKYTLPSKLQNLHMVGVGGTSPQQIAATQGKE